MKNAVCCFVMAMLFFSAEAFAFKLGVVLAERKACLERGGQWKPPRECVEPPKSVSEIDALKITEASLKCIDCIDHAIIGECNWMDVRAFPPKVSFHISALVKHYLPDYVVSVYSNKPPYKAFSESIVETLFGETPAGSIRDNTKLGTHYKTELDYKHVDIITNPAILVFNGLSAALGLSAKSVEKIPEKPLFISRTNPAWKSPIIEQFMPNALTGFPRMSQAPEYWGPIWPRSGWTSLPFDAMSALVTAHRATHILTGNHKVNSAMGHIYIPPGDDCGNRCWKPPQVELSNRENRFQMVYPKVQNNAYVLPRSGDWVNGHEFHDERYAWVLWRRYEYCERKGNRYLGRIKWDS